MQDMGIKNMGTIMQAMDMRHIIMVHLLEVITMETIVTIQKKCETTLLLFLESLLSF